MFIDVKVRSQQCHRFHELLLDAFSANAQFLSHILIRSVLIIKLFQNITSTGIHG